MFKITLKKSDQSFDFESGSGSLLEFLEQKNIPVESACRAAACGTCMIRLLEGKVGYMTDQSFLSEEEISEGLILSCMAVPGTDLVLDL